MKLEIKDYCIRCGICITLYPELYEMDFNEDAVRIKVDNLPEDILEKARQSIKDCAVTAIQLHK